MFDLAEACSAPSRAFEMELLTADSELIEAEMALAEGDTGLAVGGMGSIVIASYHLLVAGMECTSADMVAALSRQSRWWEDVEEPSLR